MLTLVSRSCNRLFPCKVQFNDENDDRSDLRGRIRQRIYTPPVRARAIFLVRAIVQDRSLISAGAFQLSSDLSIRPGKDWSTPTNLAPQIWSQGCTSDVWVQQDVDLPFHRSKRHHGHGEFCSRPLTETSSPLVQVEQFRTQDVF